MDQEMKQEGASVPGANEGKGGHDRKVLGELGDSMGKFAGKAVESIKKTIDKAMISRNTVLTIRVNDDANDKLSMLVETGLFKSRSESAAFLIEEGIKHQKPLFEKVAAKLEEIGKLREDLKNIISDEIHLKKEE